MAYILFLYDMNVNSKDLGDKCNEWFCWTYSYYGRKWNCFSFFFYLLSHWYIMAILFLLHNNMLLQNSGKQSPDCCGCCKCKSSFFITIKYYVSSCETEIKVRQAVLWMLALNCDNFQCLLGLLSLKHIIYESLFLFQILSICLCFRKKVL